LSSVISVFSCLSNSANKISKTVTISVIVLTNHYCDTYRVTFIRSSQKSNLFKMPWPECSDSQNNINKPSLVTNTSNLNSWCKYCKLFIDGVLNFLLDVRPKAFFCTGWYRNFCSRRGGPLIYSFIYGGGPWSITT
jgi:hypothetical protein